MPRWLDDYMQRVIDWHVDKAWPWLRRDLIWGGVLIGVLLVVAAIYFTPSTIKFWALALVVIFWYARLTRQWERNGNRTWTQRLRAIFWSRSVRETTSRPEAS